MYAAGLETLDPAGDFGFYLRSILGRFLLLVGAVAVGFVIYGGFLYIISQGDPEKVTKAKKTLMWAVLGTMLIVLSYAIVVKFNSLLNIFITK